MSTETLLDIQGLETAYGNSQVLFGLDMQLQAGTTSTLLGRNGMGKTTTVRSILGLTPPRNGSIRFRGERIEGLSPDRIARMGVALVPEGRSTVPELTVDENLRIAANRQSPDRLEPQATTRRRQLAQRLPVRRVYVPAPETHRRASAQSPALHRARPVLLLSRAHRPPRLPAC